jgi:hypothetical protein
VAETTGGVEHLLGVADQHGLGVAEQLVAPGLTSPR